MTSQSQLLNPTIKAQFVANFPNITLDMTKPANKSFEETLENIFTVNKDESRLQKARRILGETAVGLSDLDLQSSLAEFEFLLDSMMDEFEKQIFNNKTLRQVLMEG